MRTSRDFVRCAFHETICFRNPSPSPLSDHIYFTLFPKNHPDHAHRPYCPPVPKGVSRPIRHTSLVPFVDETAPRGGGPSRLSTDRRTWQVPPGGREGAGRLILVIEPGLMFLLVLQRIHHGQVPLPKHGGVAPRPLQRLGNCDPSSVHGDPHCARRRRCGDTGPSEGVPASDNSEMHCRTG